MTSRFGRGAPAALLALTMGLCSCSITGEPEAGGAAATTAPATIEPTESTTESTTPAERPGGTGPLARFYSQQVEWEPCEAGFECGEVEVPVDYTEPGGATIQLAVNRRLADDQAARIGSLVVNPGGPGASGVDYAPQVLGQFGEGVLARYDVVGFDPRGVAESAPVECLTDPEGVDRLLAVDPDPDTNAEIADLLSLVDEFTRGCARDAGALLPHLSTTDVARDLDVIRAAVGDEELHYYGASYGTFIGAVYAELFPRRVGRLVLDGAVNPALDNEAVNKQQAAGFETALRAYVANCVSGPDCPLGDSLAGGITRMQRFLDDLDARPLPTSTDRELTQGLGLYGIALPLYVEDYWGLLDEALAHAFAGDGATLLSLADAYWGRTDTGYTGNMAQAIYAVNCLDDPSDATVAEMEASVPEFERVAPTFGRTFAWSPLVCSRWPVEPAAPVPPVDGRGAAPILVVGTTRDPATPYRWARAMADQLASGVLLTRVGDGHTAYGVGNRCIDSTVDAYLTDGVLPPSGKRC